MVTPKQARTYLSQLAEFNADPLILFAELDRIRTLCVEGYLTEKATAKGEVLTVRELDPRTAVAAIKETRELIKTLLVVAGDNIDEGKDYVFQLNVITSPPKQKEIKPDEELEA